MEDIKNIIKPNQIKDANTLTRWIESGIISEATNNKEFRNNISGTGGFLQTLVDQQTSLLFGKLPDYEIESDNTELKELINQNIIDNKTIITKELHKAIKNYVVYGVGVVKFLVVDGSLTIKANNPCNITFDLKNNKYIATTGKLNINSKIAKKLNSQNENIIEVDFNNSSRIFCSANKTYVDKLNYPNTFSTIFNNNGANIQSKLLKIKEYLLNHEALTNRMLDLQAAVTVTKGILDDRFSPIYREFENNSAVELIEGTIPTEGANPFYWVDNSPISNNLQVSIEQIALLEQKAYQNLGLTEIFQGRDEVNQTETTVDAMDRTEKANVLQRAEQEKVNEFIKDVITKYIENILVVNGIEPDVSLHIETDAIGILENQQKDQQNQQTLLNIFNMLDKAQGLVQVGNVAYIELLKQTASSELQKSNFKNKMIEEVENAFDAAIEQANSFKMQQQQAMAAQAQPNPEQQAQMQLIGQKVQQGQLNQQKTALEIQQKQNELMQTPQDEALKNAQIAEKNNQSDVHLFWLFGRFKSLLKSFFSKSQPQNQPPPIEGE